jgi:hypothetical protein
MLRPGRRSPGPAVTVPGIAGALPGSQPAIGLLHIRSLREFFNLPTWLTTVGAAASRLPAWYVVTGRRG